MIIRGLNRAERRMDAYMVEAGARAVIHRKVDGEAWETIVSNVPIIIEAPGGTGGTGNIDPRSAGEHDSVSRKITVSKNIGLMRGDRLTVSAPRGTGVTPGQVLTVSEIHLDSMAPCTTGIAAIEEVAVERYAVTFERWEDDVGEYEVVLSTEAAVVVTSEGSRTDTSGASGEQVTGTVIIEPVPAVSVQVMDSLTGIPWARGAFVTHVYPVVGNRLEVAFAVNRGTA